MTILLVEDEEVTQLNIKRELKRNNYEVEIASNYEECFKLLNEKEFQVVILDIQLPGKDGFQIAKDIRAMENNSISLIPIVFHTGKDSLEYRERGYQLQAYDFIKKGKEEGELLTAIKNIINPEQIFKGHTVLLCEDDDVNLFLINKIMESQGAKTIKTSDGQTAIDILDERSNSIDLVLLDVITPIKNGLEVLTHVRENLGLKNLPVIFLSALNDSERVTEIINSGATDFIEKPIVRQLLLPRLHAHMTRYLVLNKYDGGIKEFEKKLKR